MKRKYIIGIALLIAIALAICITVFATNKQDDKNRADSHRSSNTSSPAQPSPVTVTGELECLPPKNPDQPHTLECATGLKTADGKHYALRGATADQNITLGQTGKIAKISGTLTKDTSTKYTTEGVIDVSTITLE